ncbi:Olfactory receptor 7G1 [Sciurus carolinensis]|uniref:Olfactory receptor 7G1 n=1 Tax=Sciurus carolinensis TaxID=30640 RepID=A0AA41SWH7_SCICA|nr:Olfactory receptor 7G1 [Sciurus carolinensis]
MESTNKTAISEFLLQGLTEDPALQPLIFSLFLSMYLVTILGNLFIILAVSIDSQIHIPMYFFLCSLFFHDICLSTSIIPKMLVNIQFQDQSITYSGCLTQGALVIVFGYLENFLLAVMSYGRYVAICHPLRYRVIMNLCFCVLLVMISMSISIVVCLLHSVLVLQLSLCRATEIPHFFCELTQFIKLTCSDTLFVNILVYISSCMFGGVSISGVIFSYVHIVSSVLRMPSSEGMHKTFSSCGSHLSVISLFYGTGFGVYISSAVTDSPRKTAVSSVMYTVVPQMLNYFIYFLRNRHMKDALRKFLCSIAYAVRFFLLFDLGFSDRIMVGQCASLHSQLSSTWKRYSYNHIDFRVDFKDNFSFCLVL